MKAIIMAGGEGSRLRPLTCDLPKPMVPIMNIPIMEHIINLLKNMELQRSALRSCTFPKRLRIIWEWFQFWSQHNLLYRRYSFRYGGKCKNAEDFLDETFIVISGDSLTNMNITKAIEFHRMKNSKATLVLTRVDVPLNTV